MEELLKKRDNQKKIGSFDQFTTDLISNDIESSGRIRLSVTNLYFENIFSREYLEVFTKYIEEEGYYIIANDNKLGIIDERTRISSRAIVVEFIACTFSYVFTNKHSGPEHADNIEFHLNFSGCTFNQISFSNSVFPAKLKFWACNFIHIDFENTTFKDLFDCWNCKFHEPVTFLKTDFLGITVFSASTFYHNALFTYSRFEKLLILRGTQFEEGLDLSVALISGELNCYDVVIGDFKPSDPINRKDKDEYETIYNDYITKEHKIPINNKRETYRILKYTFEKRNDIATSIKFKVLEKETLLDEIDQNLNKSTIFQDHNLYDWLNLWLNKISNNHGSSYVRATFFTLFVGFDFFITSIAFTNKYCSVNWDGCSYGLSNTLTDYFVFMSPLHSIEYLGVDAQPSTLFYFFDTLGRIFVSYGYYQFVQAFRKYR